MVEQLIRDQNHVPVAGGVSSASATTVLPFTINSSNGRLLVDNAGGGTGTVTDVSVVTANGFAGTVADSTTTPAITLTTTVNAPALAGNGTAISAATTTGSGSTVVLATDPTFPASITVGAAAGVTGDILLKGTTSGTVTLTVADAAGTWTLQLPDNDGSSGQVLTTNGSGVTTWETPAGGGNVSNTGTPANNQIAIWTDATTIEGVAGLTFDGTTLATTALTVDNITIDLNTISSTSGNLNITPVAGSAIVLDGTISVDAGVVTGITSLGVTGTRVTAGFFTDLTVTNAIAGSITGTAAVATTVTVANEATDTTCFPLFVTAATGDLGPKSNTGLTFNSNTALLTATLLAGTTSVTSATIRASSNDSGSIGASGTAFSDLYLASGALIDFAAGNSVITHSSGILTVTTGDLRVTTAGTNSASVVTVGGTQTLTSKTLTSPTINTPAITAPTTTFTVEPGADDTAYGDILAGLLAGDTIAQWDLVYLDSTSGRYEFADADAAATAGGVMLGLAMTSGTDGNALTILKKGIVRNDGWNWSTVGGPLYVSTSPGALTQTAPSGTDDVIRVVGYALSDDAIWFEPSNDWITHV